METGETVQKNTPLWRSGGQEKWRTGEVKDRRSEGQEK
jgi:hypothetical protein